MNRSLNLVVPFAASDSLSSASVKVILPVGDTNAPGKAALATAGGQKVCWIAPLSAGYNELRTIETCTPAVPTLILIPVFFSHFIPKVVCILIDPRALVFISARAVSMSSSLSKEAATALAHAR